MRRMPAVPLSCGQCGAPLDVPESVRFVTCAFCSTRLELVHEGNAHYTVALANLGEKVADLAGEVKLQRLLHELDQIDRDWDAGRFHEQIPEPPPSAISGDRGWRDWAVAFVLGATVLVVPWFVFEHVIEWQNSVDEDIVWAFRFASCVVAAGAAYSWVLRVRGHREDSESASRQTTRHDIARHLYDDARNDLRRQIAVVRGRSGELDREPSREHSREHVDTAASNAQPES